MGPEVKAVVFIVGLIGLVIDLILIITGSDVDIFKDG
jgi:preprotein translocase subunit Sss1